MAAQRRTYDTNAPQIDGRVPAASEARNTAASYNAVKVKKTAPEPDPNLAVPSIPWPVPGTRRPSPGSQTCSRTPST